MEDGCFETLYLESDFKILIQWFWDGAQEFVVLTSISVDSYHQRSLENTALLYTRLSSSLLHPSHINLQDICPTVHAVFVMKVCASTGGLNIIRQC